MDNIPKQTIGGWSDYLFQTILADIKANPNGHDKAIDYPPPLMGWGHPGVGKSSGVRRARDLLETAIRKIPGFEKDDVGLIDIRMSQFDAVDLRGVPTITAGRTSWSTPDWLPAKGKNPRIGLVFCDEYFLSSPSVLNASLQFTLDRCLGDYSLPPLWYVVAASNRVQDKASVPANVNAASLNRFEHREVISDVDGWIDYAENKGLREEVIGFIRFRGDGSRDSNGDYQDGLLVQYPNGIPKGTIAFATPRTWEWVSNKLDQNLPKDLESLAIEGLVGPAPAAEFKGFLHHYRLLGDLDLEEIEKDPEGAPISKESSVVYAITTHLARKTRTPEQLDAFIRWASRTSPEYAIKLVRDVTRRTPDLKNSEVYLKFKAEYVEVNTIRSSAS